MSRGRLYRTPLLPPAHSGKHTAPIACGSHHRHRYWAALILQGADAFATGSAYGALVYSRTAVILETLARVYGKPKMDRALGVYTRRFRFKHPRPNDLIATIKTEVSAGAAENLHGLHCASAGLIDTAGSV